MRQILGMVDKVAYWLDIVDYDIETAKAMFTTRRWLYVGFMCHQVIEKTLKAYWCSKMPEDSPRTHNLVQLSTGSGISNLMSDEQNALIDEMMPLNIEARYPEYKEKLLKRLTPQYCETLLNNTIALQLWIREQLLK